MESNNKNNRSNLKWIIMLIFILIVAFFARMVYKSWLNTNMYNPQIKLSNAERKLVKELSENCQCKVELAHSYELINKLENDISWKEMKNRGLDRVDTVFNKKDSTLSLFFQWTRGEDHNEHYNQNKDICFRDSISRFNYARTVTNKLLAVTSYKQYYQTVRINFSTWLIFGDGTGSYLR